MPSISNCPGCKTETSKVVKKIRDYDLVKCPNCTLIFVPQAQLSTVDYDELYDANSQYKAHVKEAEGITNQGARTKFSRARRYALEAIQGIQPKSLLEVGCGVGNFLAWIEDFGIDCWGLDVSAEAISMAKSHLTCPLFAGELAPSVFEGLTFEMICSWEVFEHISTTGEFLHQLYERLEPGGRLFLSTPNYGSTWMWNDVDADPRGVPPIHVTFWNEKAIRCALENVGFEDVRVRPCSIPLNPARRSVSSLLSYAVVPDALLRRGQRRTLLVEARKS